MSAQETESIEFPVFGVVPKHDTTSGIIYGVYGTPQDAVRAHLANRNPTTVVAFYVKTTNWIGEFDHSDIDIN